MPLVGGAEEDLPRELGPELLGLAAAEAAEGRVEVRVRGVYAMGGVRELHAPELREPGGAARGRVQDPRHARLVEAVVLEAVEEGAVDA